MRKCEYCGTYVRDGHDQCQACGAFCPPEEQKSKIVTVVKTVVAPSPTPTPTGQNPPAPKKTTATFHFLICLFLGMFGVHRFLQGKIFTGILWACTFGLFWVGYGIDVLISLGNMIQEARENRSR